MTHASCADCGLRFTAAYAATVCSCPLCCAPLRVDTPATEAIGLQLFLAPPPTLPRPTRESW
jgi:hypothetical protein